MWEAERKYIVGELPMGEVETSAAPAVKPVQTKKSYASSCRICLSRLMDPARLVCGHKFCESCLDKYWKANDEPEFVVCPLCRDFAFNIGFTEKVELSSTRDLRRKFDPHHREVCPKKSSNILSFLYFKFWPIMMPIIYLMVQLIRPFFMDLLFMFS